MRLETARHSSNTATVQPANSAARGDHVGAAAETRVDQYGDAPLHRIDDLGESIDGRAAGILAARTVIGNDDAVEAGVRRQHRVFPGKNSLGQDLHLRDVAQTLEEFPRHRR